MPELTELIQLSRFAGERFDLIQAKAGNSSLKVNDETLLIKQSGLELSEIHSEDQLCEVTVSKLLQFIAENENVEEDRSTDSLDRAAHDCLIAACRTKGRLPSNETFLHALLGPLTLHTHPPVVTSIVCQRGWREKISGIIPDAIFVDYHTPGIRAAIATKAVLEQRDWKKGDEAIIFMQNHGLVVCGGSAGDVANKTNEVVAKLSYFLGVDWSRYRLSNRISDLILSTTGDMVCSYLSEDTVLLDAVRRNTSCLLAQPVFPDQVIYSGPAGLELTSFDDEKPLINYIERYGQLPRIVVYKASSNNLFIVAENMHRCREIEEVLKAHVLTLTSASMPNVQFLSDDELIYLMDWDSEKNKETV